MYGHLIARPTPHGVAAFEVENDAFLRSFARPQGEAARNAMSAVGEAKLRSVGWVCDGSPAGVAACMAPVFAYCEEGSSRSEGKSEKEALANQSTAKHAKVQPNER